MVGKPLFSLSSNESNNDYELVDNENNNNEENDDDNNNDDGERKRKRKKQKQKQSSEQLMEEGMLTQESKKKRDNHAMRRRRRHKKRFHDNGSVADTSSGQGGTTTSVTTGNNTASDDDEDETEALVRRKNRVLSGLRWSLLFVWLLAGVLISTFVYLYTKNSSKRHQEERFQNDAGLFLATYYERLTNQVLVSMSSTVLASEEGWPFVTLPTFPAKTIGLVHVTRSVWMGVCPVIRSETERRAWEQYAIREWEHNYNHHSFSSGNIFRETNNTSSIFMAPNGRTIQEGIYELLLRESSLRPSNDGNPPPYCPLWQVGPISGALGEWDDSYKRDLIMWNLYSVPVFPTIPGANSTFVPHITPVLEPNLAAYVTGKADDTKSSPHCMLFTPILQPASNSEVDGMVATAFEWSSQFQDIFKRPEEDVVVVLLNTCGQTHTFRVQGTSAVSFADNVVYLGPGDLHDPKAHSSLSSTTEDFHQYWLETLRNPTSPMAFLLLQQQKAENMVLDWIQVAREQQSYCWYNVRVYPSPGRYESDSTTPVVYTVVSVLLFCLLGTLFYVYHLWVEKRQNIVMESAVRSSAIVRSLFPAVVRSRLFGRRNHAPTVLSTSSPSNGTNNSNNNSGSNLGGTSNNVNNSGSNVGGSNNGHDRNGSNHPSNASNNGSNGDEGYMDDMIASRMTTPKIRLKRFLKNSNNSGGNRQRQAEQSTDHNQRFGGIGNDEENEPIAELFPRVTIMFADIAGFTAWSSEREPTQVFKLLETLYHAFDLSARKYGVFKVETIGDCYVAVTGLPEPIDNHAFIMASFAYECLHQMGELTKSLEVSLGPGTSDLALRIGLHSGAVTAGVLRGEKSRFQLFGDTMNTASRMESTGEPYRIQVSQSTFDLLSAAGKAHWLAPRDELVYAKGKGNMQTYWLRIRRASNITINTSSSASAVAIMENMSMTSCMAGGLSEIDDYDEELTLPSVSKQSIGPWSRLDESWASSSKESHRTPGIVSSSSGSRSSRVKEERLIDWNVEVLLALLKKVVQQQQQHGLTRQQQHRAARLRHEYPPMSPIVLDEVTEVIRLPPLKKNRTYYKRGDDHKHTPTLAPEVKMQLRKYVAAIASKYRDVPFHNFDHASHVTMSANKLIKRIVAPDSVVNTSSASSTDTTSSKRPTKQRKAYESQLHASTFGISSDPLTQFAVVFAALIHDVDHLGVPNAQLVKKGHPLAVRFHNKSVAEQNSVVVAWDILMEPHYSDLQAAIFGNEEGRRRFRQLLVNSVMATDILDTELLALRKKRWDKAFHPEALQPRGGGGAASSVGSATRASASTTSVRRRSGTDKSNSNSVSSDGSYDADSSSVRFEDEYNMNRKATIVIEHIIQASDVAHTMQHWHIFCKWNKRLFDEMYGAYLDGHSANDPSIGWYEGQLSFFDNYVVPLAKKLEECGVFGVSSDEYLTYALENRKEWEMKGRQISRDMVQNTGKNNPFRIIQQEKRQQQQQQQQQHDVSSTTISTTTGSSSPTTISTGLQGITPDH